MDEDTIFAPMTALGRAAISTLRLSGPATGPAVLALAGRCPQPRKASLRRLRDAAGDVLDEAVVIWSPAPHSYTGEDVAELHLHGGRAVLDGVVEALMALGLRMAEPGEFSRRAFLNGRMDLVQAEAIGDLVAAETAGQRRQALRQMEGALGRVYEDWSDRVAGTLAHQEALIDFPDEALPPEVEAILTGEITRLTQEIGAHLNDGQRGEKMRDGLVFVIQGAPNAGKSTLMNALAGRDVAIVSPIAGTTRDALEVHLVLGDAPVTLIDTAGLRETEDPVEAEGVRRARARASQADLVLSLVSVEASDTAPTVRDAAGQVPTLVIATKADLGPIPPGTDLAVSVIDGTGMPALHERLHAFARTATAQSGPPPLTRQRHRAHLQQAHRHLCLAIAEPEPELRAEEMRLALSALGGITGKIGVEALLDRIFADFCIGK
ncbi:tRNA uridine-5-carboxymethylaminomethyl(34) synthesis GTPase MnmE [Acidisoma cellulosilytica]|uniref:tRNA modification GTPase MnmE n=1 Tax=Acidisoma cellulosilyticum TaxID=2802395 RepID=A0A964E3P7_9PROT|nr:tRNA uridine-5-carboxymethylaminomethyl(34) synthesis GTPase MnmE [Acidisoma cellulosilyticum]MCB8880875.1 tRNA uridine-5-carboxymethylaminomethyl(34) synthesis GTPase MnmE [Acidisoma cellulosilyticum]